MVYPSRPSKLGEREESLVQNLYGFIQNGRCKNDNWLIRYVFFILRLGIENSIHEFCIIESLTCGIRAVVCGFKIHMNFRCNYMFSACNSWFTSKLGNWILLVPFFIYRYGILVTHLMVSNVFLILYINFLFYMFLIFLSQNPF